MTTILKALEVLRGMMTGNKYQERGYVLKRELDCIDTELEHEGEIAQASIVMAIAGLLQEADQRGMEYSHGFRDGFDKGMDLCFQRFEAMQTFLSDKYSGLLKDKS